jgi:hypothetical protein
MQTPTQALLLAADPVLSATDAQGRVLTLRRLGALDKLRLFETAGADLSRNDRWLGMAVLACSITAMDAVPYPVPSSKAAIEAMIQRLGDDGIAAVAAALSTAPVADKALAGN